MATVLPEFVFHVEGMMCQKNCGSTVQRALEAIDGVKFAKVSFHSKTAEIWLKSNSNTTAHDIQEAVEDVGFDANLIQDNTASNEDFNYDISTSAYNQSPTKSHTQIKQNKQKNNHHTSNTGNKEPIHLNESSMLIELKISGMSCANCVKSIENNISMITGIQSIKIALLSEKAEIIYDSLFISSEIIVEAIESLGYKVKLTSKKSVHDPLIYTYLFTVTGMSCTNCVNSIETSITTLPGVQEVNISLLTNKMIVKVVDETCHIPTHIHLNNTSPSDVPLRVPGPRDLIDHLDSIGYRGKLIRTISSNVPADSLVQDSDTTGVTELMTEDSQEESTFQSSELISWAKLLFISAIFGIPIMCIHLFVSYIPSLHRMLHMPAPICNTSITTGQFLMLCLSTPIQIFVGYKFYRSAYLSALHHSYGMDFLITLGTTITYVYSLSSVIIGCSHDIPVKHLFFEASGMLFLFVTFGKFLESYAKGQTISAISTLLKMQPQEAILVEKTNFHLTDDNSTAATTTTTTNAVTAYKPTENHILSVENNEKTRQIHINLVQRNDILKVLPGARIPTDGIIIFGSSYVNESMISGESAPVAKTVGNTVFGSTVNQNDVIYIRVTAISSENALSQIISLVESAQMNKAPIQSYADQLATTFTPAVVLLSLLTFTTWYIACYTHQVPEEWYQEEFGNPVLFSMLFAISVIVISCPCALGLATPTAIMVGTTVGALNGILIKGGPAFETAHKVNTVIFDKTGTLTMGKPSVTDIILYQYSDQRMSYRGGIKINVYTLDMIHEDKNTSIYEDIIQDTSLQPPTSASPLSSEPLSTQEDIIRYINRIFHLAASAEQSSQHPLADAILYMAKKRQITLLPIQKDSSTILHGMGICLKTNEGTVYVGNRQLLIHYNIEISIEIDRAMNDIESQGKTVVCVALNHMILGSIAIADTIKSEAYEMIQVLKKLYIDIWMVTGDHALTAESIAEELDIPQDRVIAGVLPAEKANKVKELQLHHSRVVAMVGDGINDSPALAQADLGIAIGAGTQVAIEVADMILIRNNLHDVVVALDLAKLVFNRVRWNFFFSFMYNVIAIPFAAGVWYPWTHMLISPQYAGLFMALSSISVVLSSLSLRLYRRPNALHTTPSTVNSPSHIKSDSQHVSYNTSIKHNSSNSSSMNNTSASSSNTSLFNPSSSKKNFSTLFSTTTTTKNDKYSSLPLADEDDDDTIELV